MHTAAKQAELIRTELVSSTKEFEKLAVEWNSLAQEANVDFVQTWEWQYTWWNHFGGKNRLHILLFRHEDRLVGIMPLFRDQFKVMGVTVYGGLRMLGSRITQPSGGSLPVSLAFGDYLTMIAHPDYQKNVISAFITYLDVNRSAYDELVLEEVPENSILHNLLTEVKSRGWQTETKKASVCPSINLSDTWDGFLNMYKSKIRTAIRRCIRRVDEKNIIRFHNAKSRDEVETSYRELVRLHQQRWNNIEQPGIFADKRIHDFFEELTFRFHENNHLVLNTATIGDRCVAADLMYTFGRKVYSIQRSFDDSPELKSLSPGNVLLYCSIRNAIKDGFRSYDFLRGEEEYKFKTANRTRQNLEFIVHNPDKQKGLKNGLNRGVNQYARLKRKLRNESDIMKVFINGRGGLPALAAFTYNLVRRSCNKLRLSRPA